MEVSGHSWRDFHGACIIAPTTIAMHQAPGAFPSIRTMVELDLQAAEARPVNAAVSP